MGVMTIRQAIERRRLDLGWSKRRLARESGVNKSVVTNYLCRGVDARESSIQAMMVALDLWSLEHAPAVLASATA